MTTKETRVAEIERGYADRDDFTEAEREITNQFRTLTHTINDMGVYNNEQTLAQELLFRAHYWATMCFRRERGE